MDEARKAPKSQGLQQISFLDGSDTSVRNISEEAETVASSTTWSVPPSSSSLSSSRGSTGDIQDSIEQPYKRPRLDERTGHSGGTESESNGADLGTFRLIFSDNQFNDNHLGDRTVITLSRQAASPNSPRQTLGSQNQDQTQHEEQNSEHSQ